MVQALPHKHRMVKMMTAMTNEQKIYGELTTKYGETVKLYESSGAVEPECWLMINNGGERTEVTALLTVPQARIVRDILDRFLIEEQWEE